jgi:hypothetical protein
MRYVVAFLFVAGFASSASAQVVGLYSVGPMYQIPPGAYGPVNYPSTGYVNRVTPQVPVTIVNTQGGQIGFFAVRDARSKQAFAKNFNAWLAKNHTVAEKAESTAAGVTITVKPDDKGTGKMETVVVSEGRGRE